MFFVPCFVVFGRIQETLGIYDVAKHFTVPCIFFKRAQLFTFLMADLRQDINRFFPHLVVAFMEHFLEGIAPSRNWQYKYI